MTHGWLRSTTDGEPRLNLDSVPTSLQMHVATRFATRFAPLNPKQSCGERLEVLSNSLTGRTFVNGLRKQRLLPLGNLVANLVPNLVDRNTLNTSLFYSKTCSENENSRDCSTDSHPGTPGLRCTTDLLYSRLYEIGGEENRNKEVIFRGIAVRHCFLKITAKLFEHQRVIYAAE